MRLLDLPFVFSQARLLESRQFIGKAKSWGYKLTLDDLQELNQLGLLVPFFRVDDVRDARYVASPHAEDWSKIARYAREGMVRDPAAEDASAIWPHLRPDDADADWWDGFLYGYWQLLGVKDALVGRENSVVWPSSLEGSIEWAERLRSEHIAMAALSARLLPRIIGRVTYSDGANRANLSAARFGIDSKSRLAAASFPADKLLPAAESLLSRAHTHDPMRQWWSLIRHSDHSGWFKMRDAALEAVWQRLAAEVLLRAHEELADAGEIKPLRDPEASRVWTPLLDRVGDHHYADGLERSLARVGLAPHPRVLLVVEGATEALHVHALLDELGIGGPHQVRIHKQGTSSDWPHELARSVIPRLGRVRGGHHEVESGVTALVVAMDAEGKYWGTPEKRAEHLGRLQGILRAGIEAQGGTLTQTELDSLVHVRTWGRYTYELANFADAELERALAQVGATRGYTAAPSALADAVAHVRGGELDIKVAFDRMRWPLEKGLLAEVLLPVLIAKFARDDDDDEANVPVIELAYDVRDLVARFAPGGFHLESEVGLRSNPAPNS